jgi:predicted peptidase
MALLRDLTKHLPIDRNRIYLIGQSMGGGGSWSLAGNHPDTFAAVVPICGWGRVRDAEKLKSIPIWAFHGDQDDRIPVRKSREMVNAIKAAGGEKIKYSELTGAGHLIAYGVCNRKDLPVWIYSQSKAVAE